MKYIDLHLHLDGSLSNELLYKLAKESGVPVNAGNPEELIKYISAGTDCADLNEYLAKFDIPLAVLQSEHALEMAAYDLMGTLYHRNTVYAEIRFAPSSHLRRGLTQSETVEAVLAGVKRGEHDYGVRAKVICCCMRAKLTDEWKEVCLETVRAAKRNMPSGVCCIDLAGAEALFPTEDYKFIFDYANELGVPFVIHAGEAAGAESIAAAVKFGAKRIGHGVSLIGDEELLNEVRDSGVCIEACPTSNVQTKAVKGYGNHPLKEMLDKGIRVCLNTDNMTVSDTWMEREFERSQAFMGLTGEEIRTLQENALNAAFLDEDERAAVKKEIFG